MVSNCDFQNVWFQIEKKKVNGVRVCVMCNAGESVRHLIEDCPGTVRIHRDILNNMLLKDT